MGDGIKTTKEKHKDIIITRTKIISNEAAINMNASIGDYSDISFYNAGMEDDYTISKILARELGYIVNISDEDSVLAVGLGNSKILTDSLGPVTIDKLETTRMFNSLFSDELKNIIQFCAISPGVIGKTGVGVQEMVEMFSEKLKPNLIIIIDALGIHNVDQIGHTIMIGNTGLKQNNLVPLNLTEDTLGIPVVLIGVPFITDTATIANDVIEAILPSLIVKNDNAIRLSHLIDYAERFDMIKEALFKQNIKNSKFTIEDIADNIERCSEIIAQGINMWLGIRTYSD